MKLSKRQQIAIDKLPAGEWVTAYDVGESIATMDALVKKHLVVSTNRGSLGAVYSPRTTILYKKA